MRARGRLPAGLLASSRLGGLLASLLGGSFLLGRGLLAIAAARRAGVEENDRLLEGNRLRRHIGRQGGVDAIVTRIGSVAAVLDHDRTALVGMVAERAAGIGGEAAFARAFGLLLLDQRHGAVEPDGEHLVAVRKV